MKRGHSRISSTAFIMDPTKMTRSKALVQPQVWGPTPYLFLFVSSVLVTLLAWPRRWLIAGAPILTWLLILNASRGRRVLPSVNLWAMLTTINLLYAVSATSWLLYWVFALCCYPIIFILCLNHFPPVANVVRRAFRSGLKSLHFTTDKIAFFELPSLTIDTDVDGLMVVRGITMNLLTLTLVVHGVEVAIKLDEDIQLSILSPKVEIAFLRSIKIGDVYANIKGKPDEIISAISGEKRVVSDKDPNGTPESDDKISLRSLQRRDVAVELTGESPPEPVTPKKGFESTTILSPIEESASKRYTAVLERIDRNNAVSQSKRIVSKRISKYPEEDKIDMNDPYELKAAVCSQLHSAASVPSPPPTSIKVTTLQALSPPPVRRFLHRLPMLLRLLLNVLSYAHAIKIASVTAAGPGQWIRQFLNEKFFKDYAEDVFGLRGLQDRVSTWLTDANFVISIDNITASAHVPFLPGFEITNHFNFGVVNLYRSLPKQAKLRNVMRLQGGDAAVSLPAFLLPHHEHLLPQKPENAHEQKQEKQQEVNGSQNALQEGQILEQKEEDVTHFTVFCHVRLPANFDQQLLNFLAILVKASKVIAIEEDSSAFDREPQGIKGFSKALRDDIRDSFKKTSVNIALNDAWIAKLVGKVLKALETANGDVGYSHNIPILLQPYRDAAESTSKLLG